MNRRTWILTAAVLIPVVAVGCASMRKMKPEEAIAARQKLMKAQGDLKGAMGKLEKEIKAREKGTAKKKTVKKKKKFRPH